MNATVPRPIPRTAIVVTHANARYLRVLAKMAIAETVSEFLPSLYERLASALLVDDEDVPRDAVTMGSRVLLVDPDTAGPYEATLVYPWNDAAGRISVASWLGISLLGSRLGMPVRYRAPPTSDRLRRVHLLDVLYQPEAHDDVAGLTRRRR